MPARESAERGRPQSPLFAGGLAVFVGRRPTRPTCGPLRLLCDACEGEGGSTRRAVPLPPPQAYSGGGGLAAHRRPQAAEARASKASIPPAGGRCLAGEAAPEAGAFAYSQSTPRPAAVRPEAGHLICDARVGKEAPGVCCTQQSTPGASVTGVAMPYSASRRERLRLCGRRLQAGTVDVRRRVAKAASAAAGVSGVIRGGDCGSWWGLWFAASGVGVAMKGAA